MSNPIKNNSKLLYLQARQLFEQAKQKFEDGSIKTEPALVASVFQSFEAFFTSMGKPNMVPRYAPEEGPPWSSDYNSMMVEIQNDLTLLFQEVDILGRTLYADFNHNMVQHDILNHQYEQVLDKLRNLEIYSGTSASSVDFERDGFLNKSKIDYSRIAGTPLEITNGAVTLPQKDRKNVALSASVAIVPGNRKLNGVILGSESNGFPGNNTEIHSITDDILTNKNYMPTFLGEEDNHSDYSVVLDGSPNTWFEFEKVNVREHDRIRVAKNIGWDYQIHDSQTVAWAEDPEDGLLKLHMQIILKEEAVINEINVNMYTPANYGAKTAIVKDILVSDGKNEPKSIMEKSKKLNQYQFHFSPTKARVISVLFEQPHKYITDIGHIFYEKKMQLQDNAEYAMDEATKRYKYAPRINGPLVSLEDLGVEVKVSERNIESSYPLLGNSSGKINSIRGTINRLMNNIDTESVDMGIEKFEGFRWCIGVRDIEIWSCSYETEGELVTHPIYFDTPLDKISLDVNENIPESFKNNESLKYDWLKYFISIDDGTTWHPITPLQHQIIGENQPPKIYTVRTIESAKQQLENKESYLESQYPIYSLRMKIVGKRPEGYTTDGVTIQDNTSSQEDFTQASPLVRNYMFSVKRVEKETDSIASDLELPPTQGAKTNIYDEVIPETPEPEEETSELAVAITNKKEIWCSGKPLRVKVKASSDKALKKAELYVNGSLYAERDLGGNEISFEFSIDGADVKVGALTLVVKVYDEVSVQVDSDVINIIDSSTMEEGDCPEELDNESISVVIDKKPKELCECDDLIFYGSIQGPNKIQSVQYKINGNSFNPDKLGTPPANDPCKSSSGGSSDGGASSKGFAEEKVDLMAIEDFGEWLDAFEEQEDCGCKKKKKTQEFRVQQMAEVSIMSISEKEFYVKVPYWKLRAMGVKVDSSVTVEVIAYDEKNKKATDSFKVKVQTCKEPTVRDCLLLESIEVHYYDHKTRSIQMQAVPANALPYKGFDNNLGVEVTVGWSAKYKGPVIMQTDGYDESGYAFQIHAVALNYLDQYDAPNKIWASNIAEKSSGVINSDKMIGDSSRAASWTADISKGDYKSSPSLDTINSYVMFSFDNTWVDTACDVPSDFDPSLNKSPETPPASTGTVLSCYPISHILLQYYNDAANKIEMYKIDVDATNKAFSLPTKNGAITALIGWEKYFTGPTIKIQSGAGSNNILITAMGILYQNKAASCRTEWASNVRYKTAGVQNPEFALNDKKELSDITWVNNGTVDYVKASFVGKQGDILSYKMSDEIMDNMCRVAVPLDLGIDANNPPDSPAITFLKYPTEVCAVGGNGEGDFVNVKVTDLIGFSKITYTVSVNGRKLKSADIPVTGQKEQEFSIKIDGEQVAVGDKIDIKVEATNVNDISVDKSITVLGKMCDDQPPVVTFKTIDDSILDPVKKKIPYLLINAQGIYLVDFKIEDNTLVTDFDISVKMTEPSVFVSYTEKGTVNVKDTGWLTGRFPIKIPEKSIPSNPEEGPIVDIVFIVDTTGSMDNYIQNLAAKIKPFCDRLTENKIRWQMGVVIYGDLQAYSDDSLAIRKRPFRTTSDEITRDLGEIYANDSDLNWSPRSAGPDTPESGYEAILDSTSGARSYSFRSNAKRFYIMMTDAKSHSSDSTYSDYRSPITDNDIMTYLTNTKTVFYAIASSIAVTQLSQFIEGTGGKYYSISSNYTLSLIQLADDIASKTLISPDSKHEVFITAKDSSGNVGSNKLILEFTDTSSGS